MKRKIVITTASIIVIVLTYFSWQTYWLLETDKLPYKNLSHIGSGTCYITFKIENKDSVYTVVMPNQMASIFLNKKYSFETHPILYTLYMNEVISHDIAVDANVDSVFEFTSFFIVDPKRVERFKKINLAKDTSIFKEDNVMSYNIDPLDFNAIIYLFLQNGSNCCQDDYSGATFVMRGPYSANKEKEEVKN